MGKFSQDVWVIGPGGDKDKTIFHFNGTGWSSDGLARPLAPTALYGFANDDVWIGGRGGDIWHFNGSEWNKVYSVNIEGYNLYGIEDLWGEDPNELYAVGYAENGSEYKAIILKYDGIIWKELSIPIIKNSFVKIRSGSESSSNKFIFGFRFEQFAEDTSYIYEFNESTIKKIYEGITTSQELAGLSCLNNKIYIREGYDIFEYDNNKLNLIFSIPDEAVFWGRSIMDIILGMRDGIAHYNGMEIQYLYTFNDPEISITDGIIFEKEVFVVATNYNSSMNYIFHGKLK